MARLLVVPNDPRDAFKRNDEEDFLSEFNPRDETGKRFFDEVGNLSVKDEMQGKYYGVTFFPVLKEKQMFNDLMTRLISGEVKFSALLFYDMFYADRRAIFDTVRKFQPDVVRAFNTHFAAELGKLVAEEFKIPLVVSAHDPSRLTSAIQYADSLVCESHELEGTCKSQYGINTKKMTVIHNPINMDVFCPQDAKKVRNAVPHNWFNAPYRVLSISRLVYGKNIEGLLEALSMVKDEFPGIVHYHFGASTEEKAREIKWLRDSLGLRDVSSFHGGIQKADLPVYYSSADAFVLPTLWEGLSRSVREALACGTPAITTNYGSTAEIVQDGYNGIGIDPKSSKDIARGLRQFFGDKDFGRRLTQNARPSVLTKYDACSSMRLHCENYAKLLQKK